MTGYGLITKGGKLAPVFYASKRKALAAAKARHKGQSVVAVRLERR